MTPTPPIYLDNHATTRVDPRVLEAMLPYFSEDYGNASSVNHAYGWRARDAVEAARAQVAALLGCEPRCLVFTSGATEANNLALKGVLAAAGKSAHFITNAAEHVSVLDPARRFKRSGGEMTILPVDRDARVDPQQIRDALQPNTALVSVMLANNEVGSLNPIDEIGAVCRERGVLLHCDAVQAAGWLPLDLPRLPVDLLTLSAHKFYGPKGVGVLYVRRREPRIPLMPLLDGGGHEHRLRSGTLAVPLIVGCGRARALVSEERDGDAARAAFLRDRLWQILGERLDGLSLNGHPTERLPGNLNVSFAGVDGDALMTSLTTVAVSSGSACTTANPEPSHVLRAMRVSDALTRASLRFGLGRFNTPDDVEAAADAVVEAVTRLRSLSGPRG